MPVSTLTPHILASMTNQQIADLALSEHWQRRVALAAGNDVAAAAHAEEAGKLCDVIAARGDRRA